MAIFMIFYLMSCWKRRAIKQKRKLCTASVVSSFYYCFYHRLILCFIRFLFQSVNFSSDQVEIRGTKYREANTQEETETTNESVRQLRTIVLSVGWKRITCPTVKFAWWCSWVRTCCPLAGERYRPRRGHCPVVIRTSSSVNSRPYRRQEVSPGVTSQ